MRGEFCGLPCAITWMYYFESDQVKLGYAGSAIWENLHPTDYFLIMTAVWWTSVSHSLIELSFELYSKG
jgi:hypothetical protein